MGKRIPDKTPKNGDKTKAKKAKSSPLIKRRPSDIRRLKFIEEFIKGGLTNATSAYRIAFKADKMHADLASSSAARLLRQPSIKKMLADRGADMATRTRVIPRRSRTEKMPITRAQAKRLNASIANVQAEYAAMAFSRITDIIRWDAEGTPIYVASDDVPDHVIAAIQEVYILYDRSGKPRVRFKLHAKTKNLEKLDEIIKLLNPIIDLPNAKQSDLGAMKDGDSLKLPSSTPQSTDSGDQTENNQAAAQKWDEIRQALFRVMSDRATPVQAAPGAPLAGSNGSNGANGANGSSGSNGTRLHQRGNGNGAGIIDPDGRKS